jgi:hypothetical protein
MYLHDVNQVLHQRLEAEVPKRGRMDEDDSYDDGGRQSFSPLVSPKK